MYVQILSLAGKKAAPMQAVEALELVAGEGIVGDRSYGRHSAPGQNLTLVEAEQIEHFNAEQGTALSLLATRRNLITRGVELNALVGRTFTVGGVTLRGVELCEPCATLGRYLSATGLTGKELIRAFTHRCGLRADVVTSGRIATGDAIRLIDA